MPTPQIVMLAQNHPVLAEQLVLMAHQILEASDTPVHATRPSRRRATATPRPPPPPPAS